jgi:hypothetical protein
MLAFILDSSNIKSDISLDILIALISLANFLYLREEKLSKALGSPLNSNHAKKGLGTS